jgi:hypothetical protein
MVDRQSKVDSMVVGIGTFVVMLRAIQRHRNAEQWSPWHAPWAHTRNARGTLPCNSKPFLHDGLDIKPRVHVSRRPCLC